jgi:hypothetical protein
MSGFALRPGRMFLGYGASDYNLARKHALKYTRAYDGNSPRPILRWRDGFWQVWA